MKITNTTKNTVIAENAQVADSLSKRLIGLLNREDFKSGEALVLKNTSSIHTFWMRFAIDVLFVDRKGTVVKTLSAVKPFRLSGVYPFSDAIELPAGTIEETHTQKGDIIAVA